MMKDCYKNKKAFTLLEMLVALGIFAIISTIVVWIMITSFRSNAIIWEQLKTQNEGRRALQEVIDDVRRAEESSIGSYTVDSASEYEFSFFANIDDDSLREKVRFFIDGTTLKKGVTNVEGNPLNYNGEENIVEIAHDAVNIAKNAPLFLYYDQDYSGTENALDFPVNITDIRVVRIQLELEKDPTATPVPLHVEGVVSIRNLKGN